MALDWDATCAKVKKVMGDKTKVPSIPPNVAKTSKESDKAWDEFEKARGVAEDKLLAWQNSVSTFGNTAKQFGDKLESSDLGCDKSGSDYKKNRADAQKLFDQFFDELDKINQGNIKNGQELDKHMRNLASYKSPPTPDI